MSRLIVGIPAFNEELALPMVIEDIRRCLSNKKETLILVVDDGSTDKTVSVAKQSGADIIVSHKRNLGVACAYKTVINIALDYGAEIICTIDGDGQFPAEQIPSLIEPIRKGIADLVIGSRFVDSKVNHGVPVINKVTNKFMALLVSLIIGKRLHDTESGFRALSREAASKLELLGRVSFSNDMILDLSNKKQRILEIPVSVKYFNTRVSKVITGVLKYGIKSLCLISLKMFATKFNFNKVSNYRPHCKVILDPEGKTALKMMD